MDWTGHLDTAVVCAVLAALAGWFVPALVGRLPEPSEPSKDKVPYAELAAAPGLAWKSAVWSGLAAGLVGLATGWIWALPALVYLVPVGVALAYVDLRTMLLPTLIVNPSYLVVGVLLLVAGLADGDPRALLRALIGAVLARLLFWFLWRFTPGMGYGDVRLSGLLGLALGYLGWSELVIGLYAGFVIGVVGWVFLRLFKVTKGRHFPFGPFMLVGAVVGVAWGPAIASSLGYGSV